MPFKIVRNDITKMHVDVIVNPTNSHMYGMGGVDGAVHKIEGSWLREKTSTLGKLQAGEVRLTEARSLHARYIIHTVGPVWEDSKKDNEILKKCYSEALNLAKRKNFESIAIPLISSGSFGYPKELSLNVAVASIGEFLLFNEMMVYLVVYDKESYRISKEQFDSVEDYINDNYIIEKNLNRSKYSCREELLDYSICYQEEVEDLENLNWKRSLKYKKTLEDAVGHMDESFAEMLFRLIDERKLKDSFVYRKANATKQTFSKIRNNKKYNPSKQTVIAFAIALKLNLDETKDLLLKAGFALSKSNYFDLIISYFIEEKNYDIFEINKVLFEYDEKTLGV